MLKRCPCCGLEKEIMEFHQQPRAIGGRGGYCRECNKKKMAEYRKKNPDKIKAYRQKYKETHNNKILEGARRYQAERKLRDPDYQKRAYEKKMYKLYGDDYIIAKTQSEANRRYYLDENIFSKLTPESEYWIGFLLADGCIHQRKNGSWSLTLCLADKDKDHVQKFANFLQTNKPVKLFKTYNRGKERGYASIEICSKEICNNLMSYGVIPNKTDNEVVDTRLINSHNFWKGFIDGDGCYDKSQNSLRIRICGSYKVCDQFIKYTEKTLNIKRRAKPVKHSLTNKLYETGITGNWAVEMIKYMGYPILDRKAEIIGGII